MYLCHFTCTITIVLSGLFVCINATSITEVLSNATNTYQYTNYIKEQVTTSAVLTRDFSVGAISNKELSDRLKEIGVNPDDLDKGMIEHLSECTPIFKTITFIEIICVIALIVFTGVFLKQQGHTRLFQLLKCDAILSLVIFVALGMIIVFNFDALFTSMHKLLFADGTWTFAYDSLLICMYPENFWIGMGLIACTIPITISIILIIVANKKKSVIK